MLLQALASVEPTVSSFPRDDMTSELNLQVAKFESITCTDSTPFQNGQEKHLHSKAIGGTLTEPRTERDTREVEPCHVGRTSRLRKTPEVDNDCLNVY